MKKLPSIIRWDRTNPLIWIALIIIALTVAFSRDYTEDDIRTVSYHLEEAPELRTPGKRRRKYIVLKFKESFKEFHLKENSYDGLTNKQALLGLGLGDQLSVGLRKPEVFHLSPSELIGHLEPLTLSDASHAYLTLAHYNEARHVNNRWGLLVIAVVAIGIYFNMKPE